MEKAEMRAFRIMLANMDDAEIKENLRSIGRIEEKNLDLAVSLLRKIMTEDGIKEIALKLASDDIHRNCIGAVDPAFFLMQPQTISELTYIVANNIKGTDLYTLWNDCARRQPNMFILNIWALQSGVYKKSEIEENFKINHIFIDPDACFTNSKEIEWFERANRSFVFPFIFTEDIVNPSDYMKELQAADPNAQDFKNFVKANRSFQRLKNYLYQSSLIVKDISSIDKEEITVTMVMPTLEPKHRYSEEMVYVQNENNEAETFVLGTNQILDVIADRPASKHYDMFEKEDLRKIIYYLRNARKKFLPGLHVIRNIPIEDITNFYANGNDKRFGMIMNLSGFKDYSSQEGLLKLAYILGLFSISEKDSQKAYDYLKENIIGKMTGDDLHKLFGGIDLSNGFKKDFAEFFMIHHSSNIHCFEDSDGVDKTEQIYTNFEKVLNFRPEKTIKTTTNRERLMPEDAINALSDICYMLGFAEEYSPFVNVIAKYTADKDEIEWAIQKLTEAKAIPESEVIIPYIEDDYNHSCKFRVLKKGDPEIVITGRRTNCCFRYRDASFSSLEHAITSPNSTVVVFESEKGYTQGWVWYDYENQLLVIDNLEGISERDKDNSELSTGLLNCVIRYADQTLVELNKKGFPCQSINLGTGYLNWLIKKTIEKYKEEELIKKSDEVKIDYPIKNHLYTDAHEQIIISDAELIKIHKEKIG